MKVFLSQATIGVDVALKHGLKDVYDWHQAVWKAFPGRDGQTRDFLTRLDQKGSQFRLLIVSPDAPVRPDWVPIDPESWKTKEIPENYFARSSYRFQLLANPTKKIKAFDADGKEKKNGKRVPLVKREDLVAWFKRKADAGGFAIDADQLKTIPRGREYFSKQGVTGLHSAVEFEGGLQVTDSAKFHETFRHGIGSAKAFGFGLLVIAPN